MNAITKLKTRLFGTADLPTSADAAAQLASSEQALAEAREALEVAELSYARSRSSADRTTVERAEDAVRIADREVRADQLVLDDAKQREAAEAAARHQQEIEQTEEQVKSAKQRALAKQEEIVSALVAVADRLAEHFDIDREKQTTSYRLSALRDFPTDVSVRDARNPSLVHVSEALMGLCKNKPATKREEFIGWLAHIITLE